MDFSIEEIVGMFNEKELQKTRQTEFKSVIIYSIPRLVKEDII